MLSVFIICKNEARIIEATLQQASKIADEIIIVDSGSTDGTLAIVRKFTDKTYHQDWLGYGAQKNHALSLCSNEWVLSLDADEVLTDELVEEIQKLDFKKDGYKIARKLFLGKKWLRWGGYYPDKQLRLFKKSLGEFSNDPVHESVSLKTSSIKDLKNPLDHFAYENFQEMQIAFMKYASLSVKKSSKPVAFLKACFSFFNKYFLQLGFLEAGLGLRLALMHAQYTFRKYL